jgi:3-oxoacyl-[acyl-carrier-protein] synthase II
MMGHLIGAAGAAEAIVAIQTMLTGNVPPTINYSEPDPACDLFYVPNEAIEARVKVAMSNSFGFGGHNSSLLFRAG